MSLFKREIPIFILGITTISIIAAYFLNIPELTTLTNTLVTWGVIIGSFAIAFMGPLNVLTVHSNVIRKRTKDQWIFSILLIGMMVLTMAIGLLTKPMASSTLFFDWYKTLIIPLNSSIFALTGYFILSGAYRTFKVKNLETTLFLLAGLFIMLRNAAIGGAIWKGFPVIGDWIMHVPNTAGFRGIVMSAAIGLIAYGIRLMLGYESPTLGEV